MRASLRVGWSSPGSVKAPPAERHAKLAPGSRQPGGQLSELEHSQEFAGQADPHHEMRVGGEHPPRALDLRDGDVTRAEDVRQRVETFHASEIQRDLGAAPRAERQQILRADRINGWP